MKKYYKYWGKSKISDTEHLYYHLLIFHCLDVAMVGEILIDELFEKKSSFIDSIFPYKQLIKSIYLFFLSLHDIGKFSVTFQNLRPELLNSLQKIKSEKEYIIRHDQLGMIAYEYFLREMILKKMKKDVDLDRYGEILDIFSNIAFFHHGIPQANKRVRIDSIFNTDDIEAMSSYSNDGYDVLLQELPDYLQHVSTLEKNEYKVLKNSLKKISWELAGMSVIADWIVSDDAFWIKTKAVGEMPINEYMKSIVNQAKEAVRKAGIVSSVPAIKSGLSHVFPAYANSPTPLQKYCDEVLLKNEPQLWILEDVTGSGKTEASLTLASRIISMRLADGIFIALPTMATSNAMYERMGSVYWRLFDENEKPSLVLSHGSRHLSVKFRESYRDHLISDDVDTASQNDDVDEGKVHCSRWISDSSKKALLADAGVGTIDQVLLSVLPVKYQSLRYYGMNRKVLIFDEVHSCDAYMLRILEAVLTGHASAGGSVILLSATLPFVIRERFVDAYRVGMNKDDEFVSLKEKGYPLATGIMKDFEPVEQVMETRRQVERTLPVDFVENIEKAINVIKNTVQREQCVCWIRNTVKDVFSSYDALQQIKGIHKESIIVFHSRYALYDRIKIEKEVINCFGDKSGYEERKGKVLLATQVVEQSLDLDFDVLISDLAPIDLIIQRAGRLHRHLRDEKGNRVNTIREATRTSPVYYVHIPPETKTPETTWFSNAFPSAAYVYKDLALLWRTKEILKKEKAIVMPAKARLLIESVYGSKTLGVPEVFRLSEGEAWADQLSKMDMAEFNVLKLSKGYSIESSQRWDEEESVPTRLGDAQQTVYLFRNENDEIVPLYTGEYAWDMSSIMIRKGTIIIESYKESIKQKIEDIKKKNRLPVDALFLQFGENLTTRNGRKIIYDNKFGLRQIKEF